MISSDEVNYLIYRYLKESGFQHSAFAFGHESNIVHLDVNPSDIQTGSLINIIQKGVLYEELEAVITKEVESESGGLVKSINKSLKGGKKRSEKEAAASSTNASGNLPGSISSSSVPSSSQPAAQAPLASIEATAPPPPPPPPTTTTTTTTPSSQQAVSSSSSAATAAPPVLTIPVVSSTPGPVSAPPAAAPTHSLPLPAPSPFGSIIDEKNVEVRSENVLVLSGHGSEVFMGTWNPKLPLFATCAADATARVWRLQPGPITSKTISEAAKQPSILKHTPVSSQTAGNSKAERAKEVTAMDWNPSGTLLATGSSDGIARIWDAKGTLKHKLQKHTSHIFVLKWSKSGDYLLSGSADKLAIVWDTSSGSVKQVFDFHTQPCLDVDWRNNNSFATCSGDTLIHVCELGRTKPVVTFSGHTSEVNAIRWDPQGQILASCSDDKTAKLWRMDSTKPIQDLKGHDLDIYTLRWSPTGPGSKNPSKSPLLATASFDKTVRIWDTTSGNCLQTLDRHEEAVYSISFSPDGEYIASGSLDRCLNIWSVKDGSLVKSHKGSGSINDVSWSSGGERVAACCSDNTVAIIDFRM